MSTSNGSGAAETPSEKTSTPKSSAFTKRPMREVKGGGPVAFVRVRPGLAALQVERKAEQTDRPKEPQ